VSDVEEIEIDEDADPGEYAPWYKQFMQLPEEERRKIASKALKKIAETKPETHDFIRKFKCELVGICPRLEYCMVKSDGNADMDVTYVHGFSLPTLLYWCPSGKFAFLVNVNLEYNDTVLNNIRGNNIDRSIRGFTG
jgi:hypothetical protein